MINYNKIQIKGKTNIFLSIPNISICTFYFFAIVPKILFAPTPTACKVLILATGISFDMQRSSFYPVPCTSNTNSFNWRLVLISKFLLNQEKYGGIMGTGYKNN